MSPKRVRSWLIDLVLGAGVLCLLVSALLASSARNLVDSRAFADRTADSLQDDRVSRFVADRIVRGVVAAQPDLLTVRPILLATAEGIVSSKQFGFLVRRAAYEAHRGLFSETGRGLVLSTPDVGILLRQALLQADPELSAKIPERLQTATAGLGSGGGAELVISLWRLGHRMRGFARVGAVVGFTLVALGLWLAADRLRALARSGVLLIVASVLLASVLPIGRLTIASMVEDPLARGALQGLYRAYFRELLGWALFLGGLGVLLTAAANSLLENVRPHDYLRAGARFLTAPSAGRRTGTVRGLALLALGVTTVVLPQEVLTAAAVVLGIILAVLGAQEIFRLILESVEKAAIGEAGGKGNVWLRPVVTGALVLALGVGWILTRRPSAPAAAAEIGACNRHPELCDRRLDEVAFAAAHNAMSNASIPDWMFPHHQAGISDMLEDGIRALMLDIHYGFPGGERIKTDIEGENQTREKLVEALGEEGVGAAERIRERLVGVDEGKRGLYCCHGFCELGATELVPTLDDIRKFLVANPEEVLILVLEDYVTPAEIAGAFAECGLDEYVYDGPTGPPWPTLGEMVHSGRRVVVFLESGREGVPWMRPTLGNIQETPYTFHTPQDFSCEPNRGGTEGSLFLINHWIETTPTPKVSNAEIVNARDVLLTRARACAKARKHLPNLVSVDFYRSGDLLEVVDELNGFGAVDRAERAPRR